MWIFSGFAGLGNTYPSTTDNFMSKMIYGGEEAPMGIFGEAKWYDLNTYEGQKELDFDRYNMLFNTLTVLIVVLINEATFNDFDSSIWGFQPVNKNIDGWSLGEATYAKAYNWAYYLFPFGNIIYVTVILFLSYLRLIDLGSNDAVS